MHECSACTGPHFDRLNVNGRALDFHGHASTGSARTGFALGAHVFAALFLVACSTEPRRVAMPRAEPEWVAARDVPPGARAQWRCRDDQCRRRTRGASPFVCTAGDCLQLWPLLPDTNEWDCHAAHGPVLCRFHAAAAGLGAETSIDPSFLCGVRRGHPEERLCIDFDPDLPPGPGPWACRFDPTRHGAKLCVPSSEPTPSSPPVRAPDCWLDEDCENASCVGGHCT